MSSSLKVSIKIFKVQIENQVENYFFSFLASEPWGTKFARSAINDNFPRYSTSYSSVSTVSFSPSRFESKNSHLQKKLPLGNHLVWNFDPKADNLQDPRGAKNFDLARKLNSSFSVALELISSIMISMESYTLVDGIAIEN